VLDDVVRLNERHRRVVLKPLKNRSHSACDLHSLHATPSSLALLQRAELLNEPPAHRGHNSLLGRFIDVWAESDNYFAIDVRAEWLG
jgi:hypothetical protein